jgi:hypothetical protein
MAAATVGRPFNDEMGHEERFPPTRLSAGYRFRKEAVAGALQEAKRADSRLPPTGEQRLGHAGAQTIRDLDNLIGRFERAGADQDRDLKYEGEDNIVCLVSSSCLFQSRITVHYGKRFQSIGQSKKPQFQVSLTRAMYYLTPAYRALVPSWP